jgi:capsular polysaccharide biosynthesis protein
MKESEIVNGFRIFEFPNVKVSPEGLIFSKNKILIESFARPSNFQEWKKRSIVKVYLQNFLLRTNTKRQNVLWITDDWSNNYFHWFCLALPILVTYPEYLRSSILLLPDKLRDLDYVLSSLKIFGIENFEFINKNEVVICDKLILPKFYTKFGLFNKPVIQKIRQKFVDSAAGSNETESESFERIYITRRKAVQRKLLNDEEIIAILEDYDFKVICAEDYSLEEKISFFKSSKYLISIHGAGLTNMLFMPKGSSVWEFRKNDKKVNNCYDYMANALDLDFHFQLCQAKDMMEDIYSADLIVDVDEFKKRLEVFLKN